MEIIPGMVEEKRKIPELNSISAHGICRGCITTSNHRTEVHDWEICF